VVAKHLHWRSGTAAQAARHLRAKRKEHRLASAARKGCGRSSGIKENGVRLRLSAKPNREIGWRQKAAKTHPAARLGGSGELKRTA